MNDTTTSEAYFLKMLESPVSKKLSRIAMLARPRSNRFLLQGLRARVTTYVVSSLKELRVALRHLHEGTLQALDIRDLQLEDTRLLATCLSEATAQDAIIYIMTPEQFSLFGDVSFGFVYR
ncbi:MAG: hypothetical protein GX589_05565 [Deltaproteobacteria bacterium]|nr:hypothetical protein [Deltaproteobacteria bacterium]